MKRFFLAFLLCATTGFAGAGLPPGDVVYVAISAAHRNDLSQFISCVDLPALATHPKHPLTPREALSLLEKIGEPQIVLTVLGDPKQKREIVVRMTKPRSLDFEIKEIMTPGGIKWVVVGIHP